MRRKLQNANSSGSGSRSAHHENEFAFILRRRQSQHNDALAILEKRFGSDDFSMFAANRIGVNSLILKDLVCFGLVRYLDGRYDLHAQLEKLTDVYEVPIRCFHAGSDIMKKYQSDSFEFHPESETYNESVRLFFARSDSDSSSSRSHDSEPMNIFKRFRWPRSIYLLLSSRYRNLSAYIRFLIYSDLGMAKEAEIERARMGPRV